MQQLSPLWLLLIISRARRALATQVYQLDLPTATFSCERSTVYWDSTWRILFRSYLSLSESILEPRCDLQLWPIVFGPGVADLRTTFDHLLVLVVDAIWSHLRNHCLWARNQNQANDNNKTKTQNKEAKYTHKTNQTKYKNIIRNKMKISRRHSFGTVWCWKWSCLVELVEVTEIIQIDRVVCKIEAISWTDGKK